MKRKSQMEILGLAIVFILIILGFLLYLRFSDDIGKTTKEEYLLPAKAQSILTAMLRTHVPCYIDDLYGESISYSISDLLKDGSDISLGDIECYHDGNLMESHLYAKSQMDALLADTMGVWQEDYWYSVEVDNSQIVGGSVNDCDEESNQRDTGFHAIELRTDTLEITFGICT